MYSRAPPKEGVSCSRITNATLTILFVMGSITVAVDLNSLKCLFRWLLSARGPVEREEEFRMTTA